MNRALVEILLRSLRGRFLRWLRQLKQPRYLIAFLAGAAYFGLFLGPRFLAGGWVRVGRWQGASPAAAAPFLGPLALVLGLGAAIVFTLTWCLASAKPALPLSETEIQLLLPAPLTRRQVLSFALWRAQIGILLGSFFLTVFTSAGQPGRLLRWAASWSLLTLFDLHTRGVQFWKAHNQELPPARARLRRAAAIAVGAAFWAAVAIGAALAWRAVGDLPPAASFADVERILERFFNAARTGLLGALLAPFSWLTAVWSRGLSAAGGAFLAVALLAHWEWVVRSAGRFEDATLERAQRQRQRGQKKSRYQRASEKRRREQPFDLAALHRPEAAILWKNLLPVSRSPLRRRLIWTAVFAAVAIPALGLLPLPRPIFFITFTMGSMLIAVFSFFCGLWLRNDLRSDLLELEILRPWPIPGARLVAAELLAPALSAWQAVAFGLALLAGSLLGLAGASAPGPFGALLNRTGDNAVAVLLSAVLLAVPVSLTSIALHNVAALGLPSWLPLGPQRRRGAAVTGQQILLLLGHLLTMAVAALPGAVLVTILLFAQRALGWPWSAWELPLLALVGSLSFWLATALLIKAGGALWDRLDPSQELLSGGE